MRIGFNKYFILIGVSILLVQSCTIEKRRYTSGFHVDLHKSKNHISEDAVSELMQEESSFVKTETSDTLLSLVSTATIAENEPQARDSVFREEKNLESCNKVVVKEKRKESRSHSLFVPISRFQPAGDVKLQQAEDDGNVGAGGVLSWIAFAFAVLSIALVILAIAVNGWAGLGYIAMALVAGVLTAVLAVVAKILTDRKQITTPWNLWFALAVGAIWAIITLRILLERGG